MRLPASRELREDCAKLLRSQGEVAEPAILEAIETHLRLLERWNARFHLTSLEGWDEILDRHLREALLPLRWIPETGRLVDLGSGNGFPALPVLFCRPKLVGLLVERSEKKALFLERVLTEVGRKHVEVLVRNVTQAGDLADQGGFDVALSRAMTDPAAFVQLASRLVRPGGSIIAYATESGLGMVPARLGEIEATDRLPIPGRTDSFVHRLVRT